MSSATRAKVVQSVIAKLKISEEKEKELLLKLNCGSLVHISERVLPTICDILIDF